MKSSYCLDLSFAILNRYLQPDTPKDILSESVRIFGKGHVFSNVILGLGETDEQMQMCLDELCGMGVVPVVRPLNPTAELKSYQRPAADRTGIGHRAEQACG